MKSIALAVVLLLLVSGCGNQEEELQQKNAELQKTNTQLNQDIAARDEYVTKVTDSINAIYVSMENLQAREKSLLKEQTDIESNRKQTSEDVRASLFERIKNIRATLDANHKRLQNLQNRLASSQKKYAGLQKLVDNLTKTVEERDRSIAELGQRIEGLERDVNERNVIISERDSVIAAQRNEITTAFYISGTEDDLEKKGIIRDEGGFPWGLFGSTTVMGNGFTTEQFKPVNRTVPSSIQVEGDIEEILPRRAAGTFKLEKHQDGHTVLVITEPAEFWKDKYLVIVTDRPGDSELLSQYTPAPDGR